MSGLKRPVITLFVTLWPNFTGFETTQDESRNDDKRGESLITQSNSYARLLGITAENMGVLAGSSYESSALPLSYAGSIRLRVK